MTYLEIIEILKKEQLTGYEIDKLFGITEKKVLDIIGDLPLTSSRFYKFIDSENFKLLHGLTNNQVQIIKAALDLY